MFYCLNCNKVHYYATENDCIFLTGYHFVDNQKFPAGFCNTQIIATPSTSSPKSEEDAA
jgi:hypothetical protein